MVREARPPVPRQPATSPAEDCHKAPRARKARLPHSPRRRTRCKARRIRKHKPTTSRCAPSRRGPAVSRPTRQTERQPALESPISLTAADDRGVCTQLVRRISDSVIRRSTWQIGGYATLTRTTRTELRVRATLGPSPISVPTCRQCGRIRQPLPVITRLRPSQAGKIRCAENRKS